MRTGLILSVSAAFLAALPGPGFARDYQADRVVRSVDVEDLEAIVGSLGHTVEKTGVSGANSLRAKSGNGLKYLLIGTACDKNGVPNCQGVSMQLRYRNVSGATSDNVAKANSSFGALSVWATENLETIGFTRYVVIDHGITMANLRENVRVLFGATSKAMDVVKGN